MSRFYTYDAIPDNGLCVHCGNNWRCLHTHTDSVCTLNWGGLVLEMPTRVNWVTGVHDTILTASGITCVYIYEHDHQNKNINLGPNSSPATAEVKRQMFSQVVVVLDPPLSRSYGFTVSEVRHLIQELKRGILKASHVTPQQGWMLSNC